MGIFGLQGLLIENKETFAEKAKLCNTNLVVDCNNLQHSLLERTFQRERSLHFRGDKYGCNYKEYARTICDFFDELFQCGITIQLVMDGSASGKGDFSGLNESRELLLQRRARERMSYALEGEYPIEKGRLLIPRLFKVVFREIVRKHRIETHQVAYEANHFIVKLANELNCPVLAEDSDFIIYNVKAGFIILKSFFCRRSECGDYIECNIYKRDLFIRAFPGLRGECLPMVNVLLGKHSSEMETFQDITGSIVEQGYISVPVSARSELQKRIVRLLVWLSGKTCEEVLASILDTVDVKQRARVADFAKRLLNVYNIEGAADIGAELERIYPPNQQLRGIEAPNEYLLDLFSQYDLTGACMNIILGKPEHDVSFLSDFSKPSPFELEFRPFSVAMVLLRPKSIVKMKEDGSYDERKQAFQVYTRTGRDVIEPKFGKFDIRPMEHLEEFGPLNHLDCYSMIALSKKRKRQLLMETFRFNEHELEHMIGVFSGVFFKEDIFMEAATCMMFLKYIALETKELIDEALVACLMLMFFDWANKDRAINFKMLPRLICHRLSDRVQIHEEPKNNIDYQDDPDIYREIVHNNLSLQATCRSYLMLNNLLGDHCYNLKPSLWFDGRFMFRLMKMLIIDGVGRFLDCAPRFEALVYNVVDNLRDSVNAVVC